MLAPLGRFLLGPVANSDVWPHRAQPKFIWILKKQFACAKQQMERYYTPEMQWAWRVLPTEY